MAPLSTNCSNCKFSPANPSIYCTKCFHTSHIDDTLSRIGYCSNDCKSADMDDHMDLCRIRRDRATLYRLGGTLQALWLGYREVVFECHTEEVTLEGGIMYIDRKDLAGVMHVLDMLAPFPPKGVKTADERKRVLAHMSCDDSVAWLHDCTKYLLKDLNCSFEEVIVFPRGRESCIYDNFPNHNRTSKHENTRHIFVKITMNTEEYAFDATGAQYGHFEAVVPFDKYWKERVRDEDVDSPRVHGTAREELESWAERVGDEGYSKSVADLIQALYLKTHQAFMNGIEEWKIANLMEWSGLLIETDQRYKQAEQSLVEIVQEHARDAIKQMQSERAEREEDRESFEVKKPKRGEIGENDDDDEEGELFLESLHI